ncbi:MAG TPA: rhodoquinone biosynthesis methyltransferase RquA [Xanthobacteraceae bacterium]|nr:rhodoquinone biosynthesis methyltransferase RquA [Xanthobacteraceae bacterium]
MTDTFMPALMPRAGAPTTGSSQIQQRRGSRRVAADVARGTGEIPDYLRRYYWWTYIHPRAVKFFERQWLVNAILWGNYPRLRDAALASLGDALSGTTLQVACAYGDLTTRLTRRVAAANGTLDVVDVLPIQLQNLGNKLPPGDPVRLLAMNAADLKLPGCSYDRALVFFLLHEQPAAVRRRTLQEVLRVVKPGGRIVIVDYALPRWWHPARYVWRMVLAALEPFALDLWRNDIAAWMPTAGWRPAQVRRFFGGLYEMTTFTRDDAVTAKSVADGRC